MKKVAILGGGNFGTAIGNILARSLLKRDGFDENIKIWIYDEETEDGGSLCEMINKKKENYRYLPNVQLPDNLTFVTTDPDYIALLREADILLYILPTFVAKKFAMDLKKYNIRNKEVVTLMKGFIGIEGNRPLLFTEFVNLLGLGHKVASLMGANIAGQMHKGPSEMTFGIKNERMEAEQLFQTEKTHVTVINDHIAVELCGALKNIVAIAYGLCDGLQLNVNTKMCILRKGLLEMNEFISLYKKESNISKESVESNANSNPYDSENNEYKNIKSSDDKREKNTHEINLNGTSESQNVHHQYGLDSGHVMFQSCGIPDLIVTCISGRNSNGGKRLGQGETRKQIEDSMNGQKVHGICTAEVVYNYLLMLSLDIREKFKLFSTVHEIADGKKPPSAIVDVFYD